MIELIEVVRDSLTGEIIEGDFEEIPLIIGDTAYTLHLSPKSAQKFSDATEPFISREKSTPARQVLAPHAPKRPANRQDAAARRAAIAQFVEERGLGTVGPRGRISRDFVTAWEEAGSPGL